MKFQLTLLLAIFTFCVSAQSDTLNVEINFAATNQALATSPHELNVGLGQVSKSEQIITLPSGNGVLKAFKVVEYDIVPADLRKEIKTYYGHMVEDPSVGCRITLANGQIRASIHNSSEISIIEKNKNISNSNAYWLYKADNSLPSCQLETLNENKEEKYTENAIMFTSHGSELRTYRLALLVTNAFYAAGGGNDIDVNAYVTSIVNNINGLYEKEIAVRFTLVSPTNPSSSNVFYNYGGSTSLNSIISENNTRFGNANFDVGHCLEASGGGVAYLGVVCSSSFKGGGLSGASPSGILVLAHELGHQFNAGHTFNGNGSGNCGPGNRSNSNAYEPGSGNTIMSYEGLCSPSSFNLTGGDAVYFHTRSLTTMIQHITTRPAGCGVITNTNNVAPVVTTGNAVVIPKNTPFTLKGAATDQDSDPLTYTWEQYDLAAVSDSGSLGNTSNSLSISAVNSTTAPLFKSVQSSIASRDFPDVFHILNNSNNPPDNVGEDLPNVTRTMNFRLTARDNKIGGGGVAFNSVSVTVDDTKGPFLITSYNTTSTISAGSTITLTWDVNGTNALSSNVSIALSIDEGASFPFLITSSTPNDGSHTFNIPANTPSTNFGRIKVASLGDPNSEWFDINDSPLTITSSCLAQSSFICPTNMVSGNSGDANFDLSLASFNGKALNTSSNTLSFTGAGNKGMYVYTDGTETACHLAWSPKAVFLKFRVSTAGSYTIIPKSERPGTTGSTVSSIFNSSNFSCSSFLGSNGNGAVSWSGSYSVTLSPCVDYWITIYGVFNNEISGIFDFSGPGDMYSVENANSGFSTTFVALNQASGNIEAISSSSDFTSLPGGNFLVKSLNYSNGTNLNSFIGNNESFVYNSGSCVLFGGNSKVLNIIAAPCQNLVTLMSPTNDISSGTSTFESNNNSLVGNQGLISATNKITGGNTTYSGGKKVELLQGFEASGTAVFKAEIGGCSN